MSEETAFSALPEVLSEDLSEAASGVCVLDVCDPDICDSDV